MLKTIGIIAILLTMPIYPNGPDEPWTLVYFENTWDLEPMERYTCSQHGMLWSGCTIRSIRWIAVDTLDGGVLWHEIRHAKGETHLIDTWFLDER